MRKPTRCVTCPCSDADRSAMLQTIGAATDRRPVRRCAGRTRACPGRSRACRPCQRTGGRARTWRAGAQEPGGGRGALLPRLRRLQASHSGERRSPHPARRIPDRLHALPAGNRAGHAAGPVRVPDPGRAPARLRCRQRLDVRRLDRLLGSDRHGAAASPGANKAILSAGCTRITSASPTTMAKFTGDRLETSQPGLSAETDAAAADRRDRRRDQLRRRPVSRHPRPDHRPDADCRAPPTPTARC